MTDLHGFIDGRSAVFNVADLRPLGVTGNVAEKVLESVGITLNKNAVPNDPEKPTITSGIRVGSAAGTSRGFGRAEFDQIGGLILEVLDAVRSTKVASTVEGDIRRRVACLAARFPLPY